MNDKTEKKVPNVSGSFQIVDNGRQETLQKLKQEEKLDEESLYYARLFMEE